MTGITLCVDLQKMLICILQDVNECSRTSWYAAAGIRSLFLFNMVNWYWKKHRVIGDGAIMIMLPHLNRFHYNLHPYSVSSETFLKNNYFLLSLH